MVIPAAILVIVGLTIAAIRSPLVRRIGFRNAVRRPREAALVMLGCVLGTALIVGSGSVADSFTASIRDQALQKLGPIDARINYESATDWAAANARLNASPINGVQVAAAAASLEAPLTSDTSPSPSPRAKLIEVDYRRAGSLTSAKGIDAGAGPTPSTAWASTRLAAHLNLKPNSVVTVHTSVPDQQFLITKIVDSALVTFIDGTLDTGDNLLVSPGTISILQQQDPKALVPRYLTLIEGTGRHTKSPPDAASVEKLRSQLNRLVAPFNGNVAMVRADNLRSAKEVGASSGQFLVTIGAFGIIAGIMLLINVLLMLAEERLAELGTMRAVGLPRQPLIASFALEGALYSIVGATLGGFGGLGIGHVMVYLAGRATRPNVRMAEGLPIHFAIQPHTLLQGIAAGFLVSTVVVLATSYRVSRLDVIRALRGLPDPPRRHRQAATPFLIAGILIGPPVSLWGYTTPKALPFLFGMPVFFACIGVLVARRRGYVAGISAACAPNMVWAVVFQTLNKDVTAPISAVLGGVVIVMSGVLFVNAQQGHIASLVRRVARGRTTVTSRLGLANPIAHRVRMLLTVAPFALVVFTLVYAEGISNLLSSQVHKIGPEIGGDYQMFATSSPVHPYDFSTLETTTVKAVARTSTIIGSFASKPDAPQRFWQMTGFNRDIVKVRPPVLLRRSAAYKTDRAVYLDVAKDPDLIIVPANFLFGTTQRLGNAKDDPKRTPQVGDNYTIFDPASGAARDVTVAAVSYTDVTGSGAFYGERGAKELFGGRLIKASAFISSAGDPAALKTQLEQAGVDFGLRATVIEDAAISFFAYIDDVVNLYRSDLGIGIVVGIAGIGVVLVRSVRDRRRQIGTLRAMGFDANQIGWSFLIEGAFVAIQGLVVGVGLGFVIVMAQSQGHQIKQLLGYQPALPSPSAVTAIMSIGLFVASILASVGPARRASRIPPAVALRLVD